MVITCPIRFREDWLIVKDAANFFIKAIMYRTSCIIWFSQLSIGKLYLVKK
ncbi:MAG: NotI family restriction endonuclease [Candidatus Competibacteraceae bacterium]